MAAYTQEPLFNRCFQNAISSEAVIAEKLWAIEYLNDWFTNNSSASIPGPQADPNILQWETIYHLCINASKEAVIRLLQLGLTFSVPWDPRTLFHAAVRRYDNDKDILSHLLGNLPLNQFFLVFQPDETGETPLQCALNQPYFGEKEAMLLRWALHARRLGWEIHYNRTLAVAARNGHIDAVKMLLGASHDARHDMNTDPLISAIRYMAKETNNDENLAIGCDIVTQLAQYGHEMGWGNGVGYFVQELVGLFKYRVYGTT
ncbi:hypothetical protein AO1008_08324 [Aspergillus oryzae 100-8]|uniref:Ankyrin repeat-containing domain-containing protein n=1 Tax=Aspergillus oryzae (strain 3.042) TaxID=1160506 RepID=I7ZUG2_ASPO3|nr:hypothetical protein Ao3042_08453 [Aspergillus oryzae 3.042]KDE81968.1 hypothetical protein AO1008_08324 [Aspergillus oryzae 100-8]|eukprot:EIT75729.1 hypothetical protein Ao3042_08453 [Aspergillus oryzae 3.042]